MQVLAISKYNALRYHAISICPRWDRASVPYIIQETREIKYCTIFFFCHFEEHQYSSPTCQIQPTSKGQRPLVKSMGPKRDIDVFFSRLIK